MWLNPVQPMGSTSHLAGHPGPEAEQLQQVVAGADEQPFPVHLRQTPQQELPEAPACLIWPNTGSTVSIRRA